MIHVRLKAELERLGIKAAAAAKAIGEPDSQGLRDVIGGRKRLTADMLAALAATGIDVLYVLSGDSRPDPLSTDERYLLDRYRSSPQPLKEAALRVLLGAEPPQPKKSKKTIVTANGGQVFNEKVSGTVVMGKVVNKQG